MKKITKGEIRDGLENMVTRIKQTKIEADAADAQLGAHDGLAWAQRTATFRDLQALEEVAGSFGDPDQLGDDPGLDLAEALASAKSEKYGEDTSREYEFMDLFSPAGLGNSAIYVASFVTSALSVWKEVEAQVLA